MRARRSGSALAEFEEVYRGNVSSVTAYFARRCIDPQTVADLTSETIVRAAAGFGGFDPGRGSARVWLFGIARNVYAGYSEQMSNGKVAVARLAGMADLPADEIDELTDRIDAQEAGRELLERCRGLPALERAAVELVTANAGEVVVAPRRSATRPPAPARPRPVPPPSPIGEQRQQRCERQQVIRGG